ncbi:DUF1566 domain-containing protein [Arenibacter aquaticus]|uniref:DUF1566 domain-containing protein n=1 Tax=Arenibacter aquaticus TaxID=2489054 RepID=A0A430K4P1_9FLAO|nr:DUF1566 domain-containing protein [Arenibacter aquaticus]RTE53874.1 DUF1566 domain-containing protein [Arenibacter aquaticus]
MEQIKELIWNSNFIYFVSSVTLGGLIGWMIASHFAVPRLRVSKWTQLKKTKETGFGNTRDFMPAKEEELIEHPIFGHLVLRQDGTWIDSKNKLMWIRGAWGTDWNGRDFIGEPLALNWFDATYYFGHGATACSDLTGTISPKDLLGSQSLEQFKKGKATVLFAGHTDWRLPTAYELNTLGFINKIDRDYEYSGAQKPRDLRERLFPNLMKNTGYHLWSATMSHSGRAWASDGSWPPGDARPNLKKYVVFVRSYSD